MNNIVRAWKDETYRQSLTSQEQAILPANPAGEIELTEADLEAISGAGNHGHRPGSDGDSAQSQTQQIVTYQPVFGGLLTLVMPLAPQCNNVASPASSSANLLHLI